MKFTVNKKNAAVGRLMPRGKNGEARLKHVLVSKTGTTAFHPQGMVRVSMPEGIAQPNLAVIVPQAEVDKWDIATDANFDIPEETTKPGVTSPDYLVPTVSSIIPDPAGQYTHATVNGELLLKMLKVMLEVNDDSEKAIRIRFYPTEGKLRIDAYRTPGSQEFVGVLSELDYAGDNIPGDRPTGAPAVAEKKPSAKGLALRTDTGRKFRG
jgi:hypothetical protein